MSVLSKCSILSVIFICLVMSFAVKAEENDKLNHKFNQIMEGLDEEGISIFQIIRSKYGVVQAVKRVKDSVSQAVESCVKENSDIKDSMEREYSDWIDRIDPLLKESEKKLKDMMKLQRKISLVELQEYFALIDKEVEKREKELDAKPISNLKACMSMKKTMGVSKEKLAKLLEDELLLTKESVSDLEDKIKKDKEKEDKK